MLNFDDPIPNLTEFEKASWLSYRRRTAYRKNGQKRDKKARIYSSRHAFVSGLQLGLERTSKAAAFMKVHEALQLRSLIQQTKILQLETDLKEARNSIQSLLGMESHKK